MSKLEELINRLCPKGVESIRLDEICNISRGKVISKDYILSNPGIYPVYSSQTENDGVLGMINTYMYDGEYLTWTTDGARAGSVFYRNGKFNITNVCGLISIKENWVKTKFLFYFLELEAPKYVSSGMGNPKLMSNVISCIKVPILPLEIQNKIIHILDNFTELTAELIAELTAELTARKKQYEYYRDKLLTYKNEIVMAELGDVCKFVRGPFGGALKKENFTSSGYAVYEQQHAIYRNLDFRYYIDESKYDSLKRFSVNPGDMIISCSGTIGKTFIIPENAPKGIINQALLKLTPNNQIDINYLQFVFENKITTELNGVSRGGAIKNVPSVNELKSLKIPLPPIDVQRRLVQVLNNFEAICSNISISLPAEIETRKKQYEFYRNQLLTFVQTGHSILTDRQTESH